MTTVAKKTTPRRPRFTRADRLQPNPSGIEYFYAGLLAHGIALELLPGDMICILAPQNNVSPALREAIRARKEKLLPLLRARQPAEVQA